MLSNLILSLIKLYQKTLSPDHGWFAAKHPYGFCRFHPTCSEYAYNAVKQYGVFRGMFLAFIRILKCNPFHKPAIDPVPENF